MGRDEGRTGPIHLALIPRHEHRDDFVRIAELVRAEDPAVRPVILKDRRNHLRRILLARRPTLLFAIGPLRHFEPLRGCVRASRVLPKSEEFAALERGTPAIGLTASPARLSQIRSQRLEAIGSTQATDYAEIDRIRAEVADALLFFERHEIPVIDVTRRSIEETAAEILAILRARGISHG